MSIPVAYTVIGCVDGGKFWSRQYSYQVESYSGGKQQDLSLDAYEGKTIRIDGFLSPGDRLGVHTITIVDHQCRPDLHAGKFEDPPQNTFDPRIDIDLKSET